MTATIVVLSEDAASAAVATLAALLKKAFLIIDPQCQTHRIEFEPVEDRQAAIAAIANKWKSSSPYDYRAIVALRQYIATVVLRGDFVAFHVDGDRAWAQRADSENAEKYQRLIVEPVTLIVSAKSGSSAATAQLLFVCPFYSIESWLYQNTSVAKQLCAEHYGGADVERFSEWEDHPDRLDEIVGVRDQVCIGSRFNEPLATKAYPAERVFAAGKSYATLIDSLLDNDALTSAIEHTHTP